MSAPEPEISIAELEKAINSVRMGQVPQVDLPPEVIRAITAAMEQLGDFSPTNEFLQKLQKSLIARMKEKREKRKFGTKAISTALGSVVMVVGVWIAFGDRLFIPSSDAPPVAIPIESSATGDSVNQPQSGSVDPKEEDEAEKKDEKSDAEATPKSSASDEEKAGKESIRSIVIMMTEDNFMKVKADITPIRTIDYPGFVWLELEPDQAKMIPSARIAQKLTDPFQLFAKDGYEDPLAGLPEVDKTLQAEGKEGEKTLYLLQLIGKTKEEWITQIEATGSTFVDGTDNFKRLLVWASPEEITKLSDLDFVRWTGLLHPKYKLQEKLLSDKDEKAILNVVIYADSETVTKGVEKAIADLNGSIQKTEQMAKEGKAMIICEIAISKAVEISKLPNVISIYLKESNIAAKTTPKVTASATPKVTPKAEEDGAENEQALEAALRNALNF